MNTLNYYKKFVKIGKQKDGPANLGSFLKYLKLRLEYKISMQDFFYYKLYDKSENHDSYYGSLHTAIHKWNYAKPKFMPSISLWKSITLHVDYTISKMLYPGLDAMDYFRYEFYNIKRAKRRTFITEGYLVNMDKYFNGGRDKKSHVQHLQDKGSFNKKFSDFIQRKWILSINASLDCFRSFCDGLKRVIIKPIDGGAGHGIYIVEINGEEDILKLYENVRNTNSIIEEVIDQHETIRKLNPSSVNTIRVYSVSHDNSIYITGGTLRMGCGEKPIDNYSAGGLAAEIDVDSGLVISPAVSQNAEKYYVHPYTKIPIIGIQIPFWSEILETVKKAHSLILDLGYVGWDVVVCNDNSITFLEANTCSGVELQQHPGLHGKRPVYERFM